MVYCMTYFKQSRKMKIGITNIQLAKWKEITDNYEKQKFETK